MSKSLPALLILLGGLFTPLPGEELTPRAVSALAAESFETKLNRIKDFIPAKKSGRNQTVYFTEDEINAWLTLRLKPSAHPSLKNLAVVLEDNHALVTADIDFDHLNDDSSTLLPKIIAIMFSGVHTITAHGKITSGNGQGMFEVDKANFDKLSIPVYMVKEIIAAVGLRQPHPIDLTKSSPLPFDLDRLDVRKASLIAYQ